MEQSLNNNFRFVGESEEESPDQYKYEIVEGRQIYKTPFKESTIIIYDENRNIYHSADYEAMNPFNEKELEAYVKSYNEDNGLD
jgi:hypothetical protein